MKTLWRALGGATLLGLLGAVGLGASSSDQAKTVSGTVVQPQSPSKTRTVPDTVLSVARPQLDRTFGRLPLSFEANQGQTDPQVQFLARGRGYTLFLTPTEAVLTLRQAKDHPSSSPSPENSLSPPRERVGVRGSEEGEGAILRMKLEGANPSPHASGLGKLPGIVNYFIGNDPKKWRTNIPTYAKVQYQEVYPGIDLAYYGNKGKLEYDLVVAPGADPNQIKLAFDGADKIEVDPSSGDLVLTLADSSPLTPHASPFTVHLQKPHVYQTIAGKKVEVAGNYVVGTPSVALHVGIQLASYDPTRALVIDPVLDWSTYLGGSGTDIVRAIAVDTAGNACVTGETNTTGSGFPGTSGSAIQPANAGGNDVFVTKFNAAGSALVYSTYLGGNGNDHGWGIAVDTAGNAYVSGETTTTGSGFPGTSGSAIQAANAGGFDVFVTKLNASGNALVYSTYLGTSGDDQGRGIAVNAAGEAYVTGGTNAVGGSFPGTSGNPVQSTSGGGEDAFVTKLNAAGTALVRSTYLGGSGSDSGVGIAVGPLDANVYVTGITSTTGSGFPGTSGSPIQATYGGGTSDAFVTRLPADLTAATLYSTYLGGSGDDQGWRIAVDAAGNAYVTGETTTTGSGFPGTSGSAIQAANAGGVDVFVTKLNALGSALVYSTYLGGSGNDHGRDIAVDAAGNAYVTGETTTTGSGFPGTSGSSIQQTNAGLNDAFITKINPSGSALLFSTYLGGIGSDGGRSIAVDAAGNAYTAGHTSTPDPGFPGTSGSSIQPTYAGTQDAFVAKICNDQTGTPGLFADTGGLTTGARRSHTATRLATGRVLVAGGENSGSGRLNSAQLYDPQGGTWTPTMNLSPERAGHTATLLANGQVLVAGGTSNVGNLASAQLYDPQGETWSSTGSLAEDRRVHDATLLPNGKVLVAGGATDIFGVARASAELFDPQAGGGTGAWSSAGNMSTSRFHHKIVLLPSGKVLVTGGLDNTSTPLDSAEQYDPATGPTGTWTAAGDMGDPRERHTATLLSNGKVLVAGGLSGSVALASAVLYDPQDGSWSPTGSMTTPRGDHTATLLPNGKVLVAGGRNPSLVSTATAELYDPATGTWTSTGNLVTARHNFQAVQLASGQVLVVAGDNGSTSLQSAELYTPVLCGPEITSISDTTVQAGSALTITGSGFGATQGTSTLAIGGVAVAPGGILKWSDTEIVALVPAGAEGTNKDVAVNVNGQGSNPQTLASVTPGIASIAISPTNPTIAGGGMQPFTATATKTDGTQEALTIPPSFGVKILADAQRLVAIDPATGSVTPTDPVLSTFTGASAGPSALDIQGRRAFVIIAGNLITVDTFTDTILSTVPLAGGVSSLEYDSSQNKLLGVALLDHDNNPTTDPRNVLVEVNPATGALTNIGTGAAGFPAMSAGVSAMDPAGQRYFVTLANNLVSFNTQTGAATSAPLAQTPSSMEYDSGENRLFGIAIASPGNRLVEVLPNTGQVTVLSPSDLPGPTGVSAGVATLDPANNRYYVSFAGQFHTLDTATGNVLSSAPFPGVSSLLFHPLWTSSNLAVATITQAGVATGLSPGVSLITAVAGGAEANTVLTVINPPPTVATAISDVTVIEDAADTMLNLAATFSDPGDTLTLSVTGNTNPALVTTTLVGATLTLDYQPQQNGQATITVRATDSAGGFVEDSFLVTVNAVNDVPSFTKSPDVTVGNNVGAQSIANWATNLSPGPANEAGQLLNFIVSNNNNALFSAQPAIAANGTLTFTPSSSASGAATVTVQIHDNGGTANGGVDTSAAQQFTIATVAVVPFSLDLRSLTGQAVTFDIPGVTSPVPTAAIQSFSAAPGPYTLRGFNALAQQVLSLTFTVNGQCNLTLP